MKLKDLIPADGVIQMNADPELEITGISYDSRKTEAGDLFVAIRGFETDGHRYIGKAVEKGAAAVLCEELPEESAPFVRVRDSRLALALCSCVFFGRPAEQMRMIQCLYQFIIRKILRISSCREMRSPQIYRIRTCIKCRYGTFICTCRR